jgi:hypothetical protein
MGVSVHEKGIPGDPRETLIQRLLDHPRRRSIVGERLSVLFRDKRSLLAKIDKRLPKGAAIPLSVCWTEAGCDGTGARKTTGGAVAKDESRPARYTGQNARR